MARLLAIVTISFCVLCACSRGQETANPADTNNAPGT